MFQYLQNIKRLLGALLLDLPRSTQLLKRPGDWVRVLNRSDSVDISADPLGVRCLSGITSSLHVADTVPYFGKRLLQQVLQEWSFNVVQEVRFSEAPLVSVIIPHRGLQRTALLEMTIRSLAAQSEAVEVIVVEQDEEQRLGQLPGNCRYLHAPHPVETNAWHKCYAYNCGVRAARGEIVICHDSDVLVPSNYITRVLRHLQTDQLDVVFPQRFLFYLNQSTTTDLVAHQDTSILAKTTPEMVKQNWVGGTLAIRKSAYWRIGGFDERFTGWTGEDREFYDRCQVLNGWFHGYIPFVHLWHPIQAGRADAQQRMAAAEFTKQVMSETREERIKQLIHRQPRGGV